MKNVFKDLHKFDWLRSVLCVVAIFGVLALVDG